MSNQKTTDDWPAETHGGCLCGGVRYRFTGPPKFINACYCPDCRKESGAGHLTFVAVPDEALEISGETRTFLRKGDSGKTMPRVLCPNCGTTILGKPDVARGLCLIRAGTLDDSRLSVRPGHAIYADSAACWDLPPGDLRQFPGAP